MPVGEQQVEEVPELKDEQPDAAMEQQQPQVGEKRLLEDADGEAADGEAAGGEPAKTEEGEDAAAAEAPAESTVRTIGYRTFNGGQEAYKYYHGLIRRLRKFQPLNEYEFHQVRELIKLGHPHADKKSAGGIRSIMIKDIDMGGNVTQCFFIIHDDGSDEDVSYRKCVANLFPEMAAELMANNSSRPSRPAAQRSRGGGGRGGRGRGRGGRR